MDKTLHPPLPLQKKGDVGITKNYRGITPTAQLLNRIKLKLRKFLKKQNGFRRIHPTTSHILTAESVGSIEYTNCISAEG